MILATKHICTFNIITIFQNGKCISSEIEKRKLTKKPKQNVGQKHNYHIQWYITRWSKYDQKTFYQKEKKNKKWSETLINCWHSHLCNADTLALEVSLELLDLLKNWISRAIWRRLHWIWDSKGRYRHKEWKINVNISIYIKRPGEPHLYFNTGKQTRIIKILNWFLKLRHLFLFQHL